ncbi:MAG TPA: TetR/AcrR family transcriptional regulator [bacterium]|nr:TetR/AcrR family transcriptional regulator [bacterium]
MADATKARIFEAATAIIRDLGPEGLTVDAVADLAGVSRKTVYNHFDGKFALIERAASIWTGKTLEALQRIADDPTLAFVPKLNAIVERGYAELRAGGKLMYGRDVSAGLELPGFRTELKASFRGFIEGIVRDAKAAGLVRPEFDTRRLTFAIINIVGGLTILDGIEDESFSKVDILKDSLKALVGGILTVEGAEAMRGSPLFE